MENVKDNVTPIRKQIGLFPEGLRTQMQTNLEEYSKNPELSVNVVEQTICTFIVSVVTVFLAALAEKVVRKVTNTK